jgi:hypothetical protein
MLQLVCLCVLKGGPLPFISEERSLTMGPSLAEEKERLREWR